MPAHIQVRLEIPCAEVQHLRNQLTAVVMKMGGCIVRKGVGFSITAKISVFARGLVTLYVACLFSFLDLKTLGVKVKTFLFS